MRTAIFPGSFDPVTLGHVDIIERASKLFDRLIVVILENADKRGMFTMKERLDFLTEACAHLPNVFVDVDHGLTVAYAQKQNACAIVRGVRSVKDFEYEETIANVNTQLDRRIETVLLYARDSYSFVSSSIIRELASYHQDISAYVPACVQKAFEERKDPQ